MRCGWCYGPIEAHSKSGLSQCLTHVSEMYFNLMGIKPQVYSGSVGDDPRDSSIDVVREQRK